VKFADVWVQHQPERYSAASLPLFLVERMTEEAPSLAQATTSSR